MILEKTDKIRPQSIPVVPSMIKSNAFSDFKINKIKMDRNRKNSLNLSSLEKAKKEYFPEIP